MIKFTDFIKDFTKDKNLKKIKCKFHMNANFLNLNKLPYDCLIEDNEDWKNLNNFRNETGNSSKLDNYEYLISFAQYNIYGTNFFVFGGIYKVEIAEPKCEGIGGYNITLLNEFEKYRKRLVIKLSKNLGINFELKYETIEKKEIEIFELFPDIASEKFKGYQNVSLMYKDLKIVLNDPTWKRMLKNVKAIYVITDVFNGKLYIGSAYGNNCLLNRWISYVDNLTGGNIELKKF